MELEGWTFDQLQNAKRKDLQSLAKKFGIKANLSNSAIIDALMSLKPNAKNENEPTRAEISSQEDNTASLASAFPPISSPKAAPLADVPSQKTPIRSPKSPKLVIASPKARLDTPKQDAFTFGSFPSFEINDSQRPSAENSAIITSDDTISDKQRQSLDNHNSNSTTTEPSTAVVIETLELVTETPLTAESFVQPPTTEAIAQAVAADSNEVTAAAVDENAAPETVSPRTRARVQQERAAARKEQVQQSNKAAIAKLAGGTPKGKPLTNSSRLGLGVAKLAKPVGAAGFKARPMPDFQKIHSKQFAQKASIDDFVAKRQENADEVAPAPTAASANVSFKATTPREKVAGPRPPLRPTTPFIRSSSAPTVAPKTAAVASAKLAKPAARPKFDLQASLAKPMTWKAHAGSDKPVLKDKTNTANAIASKQAPVVDVAPVKPEAKIQGIPAVTEAGTKRKSLASSGDTAEERRKKYGESVRRATLVSH